MDAIRRRAALQLRYADPAGFLSELRRVESFVAASSLSDSAKQLRSHQLKPWKQTREAALFCHGLGIRHGYGVLLGREEAQDYDFVALCDPEGACIPLFVQLKEVVRPELEANASVQATVDALGKKYVDSRDLTVAIYLNRPVGFDPDAIKIPAVPLAGLWVFGAITPDRSEWALWGDLLETRIGTRFSYPDN